MNLHELFQTFEFRFKKIKIRNSTLYLQNIYIHILGESRENRELSRNCKLII